MGTIAFSDIFSRAIGLFDDPDISLAYFNDPAKFAKIMRPYLINGKGRFSNPTILSDQLSIYSAATGETEVIDGNGSTSYVVTTVPDDNSLMSFKIAGIPDPTASYDPETSTVTFSQVVPVGTECSFEWYFPGAFTQDVTGKASRNLNLSAIQERVVDILAHCTLLAWAERNKNFILEIRNLLNDTDFNLHSPGSTTTSKVEWYNNLKWEVDELTCSLSWDVSTNYRRGYRFGGNV